MDTFKIAVSNFKTNGKLSPLDPRWPAFNASFLNMDLEKHQILDTVYYGKAITTQHKNQWREGKNYLCGQHLGLDMDTDDERSSLSQLSKDKFIQKYSAFIHTTISHMPEKPRARVIFLLDQPIMQAKNYTMAASALLWLFGTADRQCKDAVRFFYGSPRCEFEYFDQVLPLEVVKKLISQYIESGQGEKKRSVRPDYLPPASQQEVAQALKMIDPWKVDYNEWLSVLMALHSQFGNDGYQLAETWAEGKPKEVSQKWDSFHQTGNEAGAVTIATVFGIAKRFGWSKSLDNSCKIM
jgi:hypothetical protein